MEELFKNLHLQLSKEDIRKIDEWKIARGMKSRTEAIRAMIRIATNDTGDEPTGMRLSDSEKGSFMKPNLHRKDTDSVEELVRKLIKEELAKALNNK